MLRFISEDMPAGEVAVFYQQGDDAIMVMNAQVTDPERRCAAVNDLLTRAGASLRSSALLPLASPLEESARAC